MAREFWIPIETPVKGGVEVEQILFIEKSAYDSLLTEARKLEAALRFLLTDTQHKDHSCGDDILCPVDGSKETLKDFADFKKREGIT